jgi:hypothetical protein
MEFVMSVRGFGTRPGQDCLEAEGIATDLGPQMYLDDRDGRDTEHSFVDGFWRSDANVVLPG